MACVRENYAKERTKTRRVEWRPAPTTVQAVPIYSTVDRNTA